MVPALVVLGAPWRLARLSHGNGADVSYRVDGHGGPADRLATSRHRHPGFVRAVAFLTIFAGASIAWRLPVAVDALARRPALSPLKMVTLLAAGTGLWLELVDSPPLAPRLPRPQRAAVAALAMWTIWILAYVLGFSHVAWYHAYAHGNGLSPVADQEVATITLWAVGRTARIPTTNSGGSSAGRAGAPGSKAGIARRAAGTLRRGDAGAGPDARACAGQLPRWHH